MWSFLTLTRGVDSGTDTGRSKQAGPEYRNLTLAYLHHILAQSVILLFRQLAKRDEQLPRSAPADAYLAPVTGHQLMLHPFAERVSLPPGDGLRLAAGPSRLGPVPRGDKLGVNLKLSPSRALHHDHHDPAAATQPAWVIM
jgi:hypothetical protein